MPFDKSRSKPVLIAAMVLTLGGCGKSNEAGTNAAGRTGEADTTALAGRGTAAWTDANIFALLDEANAADSSHGFIASTKGTSSALREFGKQMMRDHHSLRAQGEALAKRLEVMPTPPANDTLSAAIQKASNLLNTTAKGKDFDKAYIDHEVEVHKSVLEMVVQAMSAARSTELKNMIQKAAPILQAHLDKAQAVQREIQ